MELSKERIESLRELLAPANRKIVIVAHTNPDGDAVGSSLAWAEVLRGMGHEVTCIVPNKYPYFLDWMPGIGQVVVFKNDTAGDAVRAIAEADLLFCLDFNAVSRLEILSDTIEANTTARRVLIDHHLSPDGHFDLSFSYPDSSSTCFLVYSIIEALFGTDAITRQMAEALYVGIMTDTGNFAYSFLTPELFRAVAAKPFPTISDAAGERMQRLILAAREAQDSVGGIVECAAIGLPAGLGDPMFDGMENRLASALFGIPAVKGVEFGAGFGASRLRGSENNDAFRVEDGRIVTETNRAGGILGGITTGMPLTLRVGIKPTPSIGRPQKTVSLARMENTELTIRGRHDPCIAHRAVPVVEAVTACVLLDLLLEEHHGTF